jgi:hypothetical protein
MSELPAERPLFEEVVARLVAFGTELVKEK